jgi:hypothetical protein
VAEEDVVRRQRSVAALVDIRDRGVEYHDIVTPHGAHPGARGALPLDAGVIAEPARERRDVIGQAIAQLARPGEDTKRTRRDLKKSISRDPPCRRQMPGPNGDDRYGRLLQA